ncbi:hypothetical protein NSE01_07630 [Novosphingobium sediminis]|uniref:Uncharacterized protein n=1 Tax=Novosphingobium sediminis TaxID=707214 RepID=A0A512AGW1_9SPHN|nr:hypothetical protein NSE01_07630 [Novosphingobium sediminis]
MPLAAVFALLLAPAPPQARPLSASRIAVAPLPRIGTVEARFQSYNIEMAQVTGGQFWKPYPPTQAGVIAATGTTPFEHRAPIDLADPRAIG